HHAVHGPDDGSAREARHPGGCRHRDQDLSSPRASAGPERRRGIACASVKGLLEMMGLIGRKVGMTQLFYEKGDIGPVTVIEAGPCTVTEIRTGERDGYTALQLGFGTNKEKRFTKPVLGQFRKRNLPPSRHLKEFRVADVSAYSLGQTLNASVFEKGEHVDV